MRRLVFWQLFVAALLLTGNSHAQSIKDLFNKENIEKAVNAVTGKSTADMTGTWSYSGSAIEFESDNLLQKAGGAVAATAAEKKLDEQLAISLLSDSVMTAALLLMAALALKCSARLRRDWSRFSIRLCSRLALNGLVR